MLLKVDKDTLQCIDSETESQDHHSKCLRKMLTHHLEAVQCPLTWELLCDCLRANTVSRYDVAEKIEQWLRGECLLYEPCHIYCTITIMIIP